jgi:Protein of unknown function (DUF541)
MRISGKFALQLARCVWLVLALAAAPLVAACGTASGASPASPTKGAAVEATPSSASGATTSQTSGGAGVATSATAIAYPYPVYPGTPGLAPDHTIVVTGFGQAPLAADGSNRAAAQQAALKAALADAKAQADTVAKTTGVTIRGVLSVSVSSSQGYCCPMPLAGGGAAPNASSSAPGGPTVVGPPTSPTQEFDVTVTVQYRIG